MNTLLDTKNEHIIRFTEIRMNTLLAQYSLVRYIFSTFCIFFVLRFKKKTI